MDQEKQPLLASGGKSMETKRQFYKRWSMLCFAYTVQLFMMSQTTIYYSVMWPFLKSIDATAHESFFGIILGSGQLASTVASPILGYLSNQMHQTRVPILIGIALTMAGNLGTMFAGNFTSGAKWVLLICRIVAGLGFGCIAVIFSYIAMCSTLEERNRAVTIRSAIGSGSFLVGTGLSSLFSMIGYPGVSIGALRIDMYTVPALYGVITAIPIVLFMFFLFEESWVSVDASQMRTAKKTVPSGPDPGIVTFSLPQYSILPVLVCIAVRFTLRFITSYDQSIGSPLTMTMFNWTPQEAIRYNGIIQACTGAGDMIGNMLVGILVLKYVKYRYLIPFGLLSFIISFVFSFPYPWLPPLTAPSPSLNASTVANTTCTYAWCSYTTRIALWQYITSYVCIFAAFSITYTPVNILYTKLFGLRKQGIFQGIFEGASSFAAGIAPMIVTAVFEDYGPRVAWVLGATLCAVTLTIVLVSNRELITFDEQQERKADVVRRAERG